MKTVAIESPYAGEVTRNVAYAKRAVLDCLRRNEAPYASHLFFTQEGLLDDLKPEERELGIRAGLYWGASAKLRVFYIDLGWSKGMVQGFIYARSIFQSFEIRALDREVTEEDLRTPYNLRP